MEQPTEPGACRHFPQIERAARRHEPAPPHVVAEGADIDALRDLRLGDERPRAAPPHEVALPDELVERGPDGEPRHAEIDSELPLRRDRIADIERLDELEDALPRLPLFGQRTG